MVFRQIGGEVDPHTLVPTPDVMTSKLDNYYYPLKELKKISIGELDPSVTNEKILLDILNDP